MTKNIGGLLNAYLKSCYTENSIILAVVGTGILENKLKLITKKELFTDRVRFCGVRNDVEKVLSGSDIVVLPSFQEGMPTVLLEAMACSRAIICSNIDGNQAILASEDCVFIDPNNPRELEIAIKELAKDPRRRIRLGNNANIKVQQYDQEKIFTKLLKYYECKEN